MRKPNEPPYRAGSHESRRKRLVLRGARLEAHSMERPDMAGLGELARPQYVPPTITTMTEGEVLDEVGPAQAYTGSLPFGF